MTAHYPGAADLSIAWLNTVIAVAEEPDRKMFHSVTSIESPSTEDQGVRDAVDLLMADLGHPGVETVANTIFPSALAASSKDPEDLGRRYRAMYPRLRQLHPANRSGTYFGRLVEYPAVKGSHDQLDATITKLRTELATRGPKSARYEIGISVPVEEIINSQSGAVDLHIHVPGTDRGAMGFPCLSFCSLQLDGDKLHMVAHYRSQYLILKGYGNYLGLGRLQAYIAEQAGLATGRLTLIAGHAYVDISKARVASLRASVG